MDDLWLYDPLSADETEAVLLEDKGQHATFSDFFFWNLPRTQNWVREPSEQENEDGSDSISDNY